MTLEEFERQEAKALRRFMDKHAMDDFMYSGPVYYWREYRCACGFRCSAPRGIYEHAAVCKQEFDGEK
jgi:hypothetical protein